MKIRIEKYGSLWRVHTGEVYWVSVGKNVGTEINGKNQKFTRPVLVLKRDSQYSFIGIPFTTKKHDEPGYARFIFNNHDQYVALRQIRAFSTRRIQSFMGQVSPSDFDSICRDLTEYLFGKNISQPFDWGRLALASSKYYKYIVARIKEEVKRFFLEKI